MPATPFDHPVLSGLLGDEEVAAQFSFEAELAAMTAFEIALSEAQAECGIVPGEAAAAIVAAMQDFSPDVARLREATARDGVVVPELASQWRSAVGAAHGGWVHFGATSQDVVDTALALRLVPVMDLLAARLSALDDALRGIEARDGGIATMGHTRMQAAIPVPAARKIASWRLPLERHRQRLGAVRADVAVLHLGGAAGTLDRFGDRAGALAAAMAARLRLEAVGHPRHSERDGPAALAGWLSLVTGSLGKMGQDIALMAQSEVGEVRLAGGGGSSAMPHKANPVGAEMLVALARFNATLVSGMHQSLVHENERSGAAWALEWMLLPQMAICAGAATRTAAALLAGLAFVPASEAT